MVVAQDHSVVSAGLEPTVRLPERTPAVGTFQDAVMPGIPQQLGACVGRDDQDVLVRRHLYERRGTHIGAAGRETVHGVEPVEMTRQDKLAEVAAAAHPARPFLGGPHGAEQQRRQGRDDGHSHQELP
jgi:hypothetical protein